MTSAPSHEELTEKYVAGTLALALARRFDLSDAALIDATVKVCIQLHNAGIIDLMQLLADRQVTALGWPDRMQALDRLCELLPHLEMTPERIMAVLEVVHTSAGFEGYAYSLEVAYGVWCGRHVECARRIIDDALAGSPLARKYFAPALEAMQDPALAREIASGADELLRDVAIAILGVLKDREADSRAATQDLFDTLVTQGSEGAMRASVLRAWTAMAKRGVPEAEAHMFSLLRQILVPPDDAVLHDAAYLLWTFGKGLPDDAVTLLWDALAGVRAEQAASLNLLDLACSAMLETSRQAEAIAFVTRMVTRSEDPLSFSVFTNFARTLTTGAMPALSKVVVSWLMLGDPRLCEGLLHALPAEHMEGEALDLQLEDLAISPSAQLFLCRKSIGWFFIKPITAASILIAVLRVSNDQTASAIQSLLADLLLRNYSCVREYLLTLACEDQARVAPALAQHDSYQAGLEGVPFIAELQPSEHRRRLERLRASDLMRGAQQQAQQQSIFAQLVHRSVLLYGNRSLSYVKSPDGTLQPFDMKLHAIGVSYEMPSMQYVDAVGLDYRLSVYRRERMQP